MTSRKLLAAFGSNDLAEVKQEDIASTVTVVDPKSKDDESSEEEWVKVENVPSSEASNSPQDEQPSPEHDAVKDEVLDKETNSIGEDIDELTESLKGIVLVQDEALQKDTSTTNDDTKEFVDPLAGNDLLKHEFLDNGATSIDETTKQLLGQDAENKESSVITAGKQEENSLKQNGEQEMDQYTFIYNTIPAAYPMENVVVVTNILPKINRYDLLTAFLPYGTVTHLQKMKFFALIAFARSSEAHAVAEVQKIEVCGRIIRVRMRDSEKRFREYASNQVAFIFDLLPHVPDTTVRQHFAACGKIIAMPFYRCRNGINRVIIFEKPGATEIALGLDGSYINLTRIRVRPRAPRAENYYEGRTIIMFNENGFNELPKSDVLELFSNCGEIVECDVLCNIRKLAIITFKDEVGANEAMGLNNKTIGKFNIQLEPYTDEKYRRTRIIVFNIAPGVTSEEIMDIFKEKVVVDKLHFKMDRPFALIELENTFEYCNSFRLDAEMLNGQELVLKPFSDRDESLEHILYRDDDWIAIWGDRPQNIRGRRRRRKN